MPPPKSAVPSYRLHKPTGQAVVTLRTPDGGRRDVYLGAHNTDASRAEYARLIAGGPASDRIVDPPAPANTTVAEVLVAYLKFADTYYVGHDGKHTSEVGEYRLTCRTVRELFGVLPAVEFGPKKLATVRDRWVTGGLTRVDVNKRVAKVKRMFRWAASEEMIPASVAVGLNTLIGLAKGRTPAPESIPIKPVAVEHVEATVAHIRPEVAAMVRVQLLTGMRPGEVCRLRPDRHRPQWRCLGVSPGRA